MSVQAKAGRKIMWGLEIPLLLALLLVFAARVLIDRNLIKYSRYDMNYSEVESFHTVNNILYRSPSLLFFYADNQMLTSDYEAATTTINQYKKYRNSYTFERNLAYSCEITGDTVNALDHYEVAHAMCPGYLEPLFSEYLIYESRGDSNALLLAEKIIDFTPKISNTRTDAMKKRTIQLLTD